jgi:hypothetical protein
MDFSTYFLHTYPPLNIVTTVTEHLKQLTVIYFGTLHNKFRSRNSIVGMATGYGLNDRGVGVRVPVG